MQYERRTQDERREATRNALMAAARELFVEKGFAGTSTPELVAATGLTRGALYHHFADKQALFQALVEAEASELARQIERSSLTGSAFDMLIAGSRAYLEAMSLPGRTRLLLIEGPAVLSQQTMDAMDAANGNRTLREGLQAAMDDGAIRTLPLEALTAMLGAMFDRAALTIAAGGDEKDCRQVIEAVIEGLTT